jgi:hypothetical protein
MGNAIRTAVCPEHGLVRAERNTTYDLAGWFVAVISLFTWDPHTPYRCPKCGRLTTDLELEPPET